MKTEKIDSILEECNILKELLTISLFKKKQYETSEIYQKVENDFKEYLDSRIKQLLGLNTAKTDIESIFSAKEIKILKALTKKVTGEELPKTKPTTGVEATQVPEVELAPPANTGVQAPKMIEINTGLETKFVPIKETRQALPPGYKTKTRAQYEQDSEYAALNNNPTSFAGMQDSTLNSLTSGDEYE